MTISPCMKQLRRTAWAGTLALLALVTGAGGHAFAQAQTEEADPIGNHILNTDKKLFNGILGVFGLAPSGGETITYRERSPLVVPPRRDLPPPERNLLNKNPQWPVDPEVKARKEEAAAESKDSTDPTKPLGPAKLAERGIGSSGGPYVDDTASSKKKEPDFFTMLYNGKLWRASKDDVGIFTGEPPRTSLTEPPPGYLTPSPAAPYGTTKRSFEVEKQ